MWRTMKKKLYDFFFYEKIEMIDVLDEENNKSQQLSTDTTESKIEARVTYKYPAKKEFRFPIIPDDTQIHKKEDKLDIPAYMRKERPLNRSSNKNNPAKDQQREQKVLREKPTRVNKIPIGTNRFVPTEVPSPIYGYNRRKSERDLHQTPAYIRRKIRSEHEATEKEVAASEEIGFQEITDHVEEFKHIHVENEPIGRETHTLEAEVTQSSDMTETIDEEELEESIEIEEPVKEIDEVTPPIQKQTKTIQKRKESGDIPFNVMMTRQDKMRYERQQRKEQQELNQPIAQQEPEAQKSTVIMPDKQDYSISMHLLNDPVKKDGLDNEWLIEQQHLLEETFVHFNVNAKVVNVTQGPSVTRFEVQPALGVKVSKVRNLSDDLKLNLSAKDIRIEAPIPGKNTIGIEIPNLNSQTVGLYEILHGDDFMNSDLSLPIGLGVTIEGKPLITDIASMPHGLIAGATGSGKSVCINTILLSILYRNHYDDVKLMLIDPKMVELTPYNGIPHLVSPVITDVKAATAALKWAVEEMESRYEQFVEEGVRDIHRFNSKMIDAQREKEKMPSIVIVIDELADLMMVAPQDVEDSICRIAQKARACGMHLLIATQRPSVDVITGLIKANVPTRIAFSVSSQVDSRTIIDTGGAERLLGKGDMLFVENGKGKSIRLQGAFVSDDEIDRVVQMVKETGPPQYLFEEEQLLEMTTEMDDDPLLEEVIAFIIEQQSASTSMLQRQFRVGYNRAARLMEALEKRGIISGQNGSKPRDILMRK